ncbi:FliA/WhiG family RNA polymerase sigma factor [bacterium]|nr:FliA/WhiG family RNA polymerase sigma factor [bacterium]
MATPWHEYEKGQRQPIVAQLVEAYGHLVDYQVQRLLFDLPASVDRDDLVSEARIGLIDAINRFDPGKNVKFETYASIRIRGAIVDYLRKLDWAPRSLRQRARLFASAVAELEQELGAPPSEEQLAKKLGMEVANYRQALSDLSVLTVLSFRDIKEGEGELQLKSKMEEPQDSAARSAFVRSLAQAIKRLPEREQLVLELYYHRQFSLREIGEVLNLSESRICQIHASAVIRLRGVLGDWRGEVG